MTKHRAKRIEAGAYNYRGCLIQRDHTVSPGFYGAWLSGYSFYSSPGHESLKEAKYWVDQQVAAGKVFRSGQDAEDEKAEDAAVAFAFAQKNLNNRR